MPTQLSEGLQHYAFSDAWTICQYDNKTTHRKMQVLSGTKGVDFVGRHLDNAYLIEIKDFRGYRVQNKKRISTGELAEEVALKVLHSIPGLAAESRANHSTPIAIAGRMLHKSATKLFVVLHLEDDASADPRTWKQQLDVQTALIQKKLRWLPCKILIMNLALGVSVPEVVVTNLPGVPAQP